MEKRNFKWDNVWRYGANFTPSTAINQLEMWQEDTFDPETIDRELGWAEKIGMKIMRVFLHDLLWEQDAPGFLKRMERYLEIADSHGIGTMFVFFDDCWNETFALGKQPEPKPYTHNSGWVQSPGKNAVNDLAQRPRLKKYVQGVMEHFKNDPRVLIWDLYNEPRMSLSLLEDVFAWAREVDPSQPCTAGIWWFSPDYDQLIRVSLENSDVVSYHSYNKDESAMERIDLLRIIAKGRPLLCTEYMARTQGSTFAQLAMMKERNVTAINWGLVAGKIQTYYPYGWTEEKGTPDPYFHDVFHKDGTLLYPEEQKFFDEAMGKEKA